MLPLIETPSVGAALFHSRCGGFPLYLCSYVLLKADSNDTAELDLIEVARVTVLNGEHFRLRDPDDIQRFLAAVGRSDEEVRS